MRAGYFPQSARGASEGSGPLQDEQCPGKQQNHENCAAEPGIIHTLKQEDAQRRAGGQCRQADGQIEQRLGKSGRRSSLMDGVGHAIVNDTFDDLRLLRAIDFLPISCPYNHEAARRNSVRRRPSIT